MKKKVVIVGGGFAGLAVAKALAGADVEITLIDRTNHHLFQPLLFQVATAALSPSDIAAPIREVTRKQRNLRVIMGEVTGFDTAAGLVILEGCSYPYDWLVVASGVESCYYGKDEWEAFAPGLKTLSDALVIREKCLLAFEEAERSTGETNPPTFVVVGGGPTGVETAGSLAELSRGAMRGQFKNIDPSRTRIILIEMLDRILCTFPPALSLKAKKGLEKLGVEVREGTRITEIDQRGVWTDTGLVETSNIIWAAGMTAPAALASLGARTDRSGKVAVEKDCSLEHHPEVFVIGDAALFIQDGRPLPALAPIAVQQGRYVAGIIGGRRDRVKKPFVYRDKGAIAVIGRARAVLQAGRLRLSGFPAWFAWAFIHLLVLVEFRNRSRVLSEWVWSYLAGRHGSRLVTGCRRSPCRKDDELEAAVREGRG
jgi:NADH:ubiquinone reductase (H+-translocating)